MSKIIAVTNKKLCKGDFLEQIRILAASGIDKILLREKDLTAAEYECLAEQVLRICEPYQTECVLHTFWEVAEQLQAGSIHLPLSVAEAGMKNSNLNGDDNDFLHRLAQFQVIGFSTHSLEQVRQAEEILRQVNEIKKQKSMQMAQAYLTAGHVFATDCKKGLPPRGLDFLENIVAGTKLPIFAIGGITPDNALLALEKGAAGVCLMSWCMNATEEQLKQLIKMQTICK